VTANDNGMEEALRRALTEAVGQVDPGADGLDRIRARIGGRPPRPWLFSVAADVLDRARHWTWRGHWAWRLSWAWPAATVPALSAVPWPRLRRLPRSGAALPSAARPARPGRIESVNWLRPVVVLAGIAILASVSFGVQPFRQAIIQASNTVLSGGGGSGPQATGGGAADGDGTPTGDVTKSSSGTPTAAGGTQGSLPFPGAGATTSGNAASSSAASSTACPPSLTVDWDGLLADQKTTADGADPAASVAPDAEQTAGNLTPESPTASATPSPTPSCGASTTPAASPSPSPSASSSPTPTPTTSSPSPTPTPTTSSPTPTPTTSSPTPTPTPTTPTPTPTTSSPTPTPTDTGDGGDGGEGGTPVTGSSSPSPSASGSESPSASPSATSS
jgi:hypothetical protein